MKERACRMMSTWVILLILGTSFFVLSDGESAPQLFEGPKIPPPPPPVIQTMTLEEIREMIRLNGYNYTVGETWVLQLSPEELVTLLGYSPPLMDLSHLSVSGAGQQPRQLPSYFDYRNQGAVTPPKDQDLCGSCWAFAGVGAVESKVLLEGGPEFDLSEENVISCNFFETGCGAGSDFKVTNYLTKYGASLESCAPYNPGDGLQCRDECTVVRKLSGWRIIGSHLDTEDPADIELIKQALLDYGPLFVSMNGSAPGFSGYTGGVFEYWGEGGHNHAVLLIGWDDSLPHSHGSGAWIAKNSWGTDWGENGYFKIAYGSARMCVYVAAFSSTRGYNYKETLYYYDDAGWQGQIGMQENVMWGAVRFFPSASGVVERVEFWAVDDVLSYEIYVYDTRSGSSPYTFTGLLSSQSGSVSKAGYYSIELSTKPQIYAGNDFIVAVRFITPEILYPVPKDDYLPIAGESYYSSNGSTWYNLVQQGYNWDVGIRAVVQGPMPTLADYPGLFDTDSLFVVGNSAYCTDVLGTAKIAHGLGAGGTTENPEGRTDTLLTQQEHDTGNLIPVGGPAVNPLATEFGDTFGITYEYVPGVSFELLCEGESIFLDLTSPLNEDICIIYLGEENSRYVLLVWGFEWEGTYAGSAFLDDPSNWQAYQTAHLLMLRWIDSNSDGLVQMSEITVEVVA